MSPEVRVRRVQGADQGPFIAAVHRSRELHAHWASPPGDPAAFRAWLERCDDDRYVGLLVEDAHTHALVGNFNLGEIVRGNFESAYLGYHAFTPFARRGYMRAGLRQVLRLAFDELELHRLEANIQPDNAASIALARGAGFRHEGFSPRYLRIAGQWRDHERWALLAEDWRRSLAL